MTDDERHAETMAALRDVLSVLVEIREAVKATREPVAPTTFFDLLKTWNPAPRDARVGGWSGEIATVEADRLLLKTAGVLWRWQPGVRRVHGPLCPTGCAARALRESAHELTYQGSAGVAPVPVTDTQSLGPVGWLVCVACGTTYAVPGLVTVGAIRAAVEVAFRGRLGLAAKG